MDRWLDFSNNKKGVHLCRYLQIYRKIRSWSTLLLMHNDNHASTFFNKNYHISSHKRHVADHKTNRMQNTFGNWRLNIRFPKQYATNKVSIKYDLPKLHFSVLTMLHIRILLVPDISTSVCIMCVAKLCHVHILENVDHMTPLYCTTYVRRTHTHISSAVVFICGRRVIATHSSALSKN